MVIERIMRYISGFQFFPKQQFHDLGHFGIFQRANGKTNWCNFTWYESTTCMKAQDIFIDLKRIFYKIPSKTIIKREKSSKSATLFFLMKIHRCVSTFPINHSTLLF